MKTENITLEKHFKGKENKSPRIDKREDLQNHLIALLLEDLTCRMPTRAIKAIVRKGNKILLIKKSDKVDIYPGRWDLPGGRLDPEESWSEGLTREVREETGLCINFIREVRDWESKKWDTIGKTVLCDYVSGEVRLSWEHTEYQWMVPEGVINGDFPEWIQNDLKAIDKKI